MDRITLRLQQLTDYVGRLPLRTRVLSGTLCVMVTVGAIYLGLREPSHDSALLFGGRALSNRELDRMEAAFSTAGLSDWEREGNRIRVPQAEKFTYMAALAENDVLPQNSDEIFFETMQSSKFYESSQQRAMRMKYATQREAAMIVQAMTGIQSATVRYVDVPGKGFGAPKRTKANVAVRTVENHALTAEQITAICDTVAYTIGADASDVVVTDLVGVKAYRGNEVQRASQHNRLRGAEQQQLEEHYRHEIKSTLSMIDGAIVNVRVRLGEPASQTQVDSDETSEPVAADRPRSPRQPILLTFAQTAKPQGNSSYGNKPLSINQSAPPPSADDIETVPQVSSPAWDVQLVTATVSIPKSHFHEIWNQSRISWRDQVGEPVPNGQPNADVLADIEADTLENVRQLVLSCLPAVPVAPGGDQVVVTSHFDLAPTPVAVVSPTWEETIVRHWPEAAGVFAICVVLLTMLWTLRLGKGKSVEANAPDIAPAPRRSESSGEAVEPDASESLRDQWVQRVRENPDKSADALSSWMRDAA